MLPLAVHGLWSWGIVAQFSKHVTRVCAYREVVAELSHRNGHGFVKALRVDIDVMEDAFRIGK
ncbi:MAG TPA: hypothetical protein VN442_10205 [Bryobacteraceae bacterium]|nr:hypothetical protein [Bryobacteraceae bacterium]